MAAAFTLAATSAGSASRCEVWVVLVPDFDVEVLAATATALPPRPSAPMAVAVVTVLRILVLSMGAVRAGWLGYAPIFGPASWDLFGVSWGFPEGPAFRRFSGHAEAAHRWGRHNVRVPNNAPTASGASPTPSQQRKRLPIDHTGWLARVIEMLAIVAAVVFAYLHAAP